MKHCPICNSKKSKFDRKLNGIDLVKCTKCHFVYANLKDDFIFDENSNYEDTAAESYEARQSKVDQYWFSWVAKKLTKKYGKGKVLDVGCGNGMLLNEFIKCGWDAYGLDVSEWSKSASKRYGFALYSDPIEDDTLPENTFDLVVSMSTLEHIAQPLVHLDHIARVIKPGGSLYVAGVPNYGSLSIRLGISKFNSNLPPTHVNYFTKDAMKKLRKYGLKKHFKIFNVKSYGIPELYWIYSFFAAFFKKKKSFRSKKSVSKRNQSFVKVHFLFKLAVKMNYHIGSILSMGDKLEIQARKK